nr:MULTISPECIES: BRCT domain-containing protein [unclassified Enterococcus]
MIFLKNEFIVFTGTLSTMTRKQAQGIVSALNGTNQSSITKQTTILVIGYQQTNLLDNQQQPKKVINALYNRRKLSQNIKLISEKEFITLITKDFQSLLNNL